MDLDLDYRSNFIYWYFNQFQLTEMYQGMSAVAEESPWHRERNIGTHTDMVVTNYLAFAPDEWAYEDTLGALACAFHDVGKPSACQKKWKEERGDYKSFGGHEQISARMWEDWAATNYEMLTDAFMFTAYDIYRVGWIIEKHLPWGLKKTEKLHSLGLTALELFPENGPRPFTNMLLADTYGRMSDDYIEKRAKVHSWIEGFNDLAENIERIDTHQFRNGKPVLYMPIGASGTGKSTFIDGMQTRAAEVEEVINIFSWDQLRMEWYYDYSPDSLSPKEAYKLAFERQCEDKEFMNKANKAFMEMLKNQNSVVVDNTNLSKKRRRFFIDQARRQGYFVMGVLLPIALQTVLDRQKTRRDKNVPLEAVKQHYMSMQLPEFGEMDDVWVIDHNLA